MKIIKELTTYHTYALESEYSYELVEYCHFLKDSFGWQNFQWDKEEKKWRFKDLSIVTLFVDKFPKIEFSSEVIEDINNHGLVKEEPEEKKELTTVKGIKGELYEYQKIGVNFLLNSGGRALLADSPGVGKAQPLWAMILTPGGWKKIGDLKIKEAISSVDGKFGRVTGIFDRGSMDIYKVFFNDGSKTHVSEDHLWKIRVSNGFWFVATTWEIIDRLKKKQKIHIPIASSVIGHGKRLPVSPYLLGLLLGDGGLTGHSVRITTVDSEIKTFCENSARKIGLKLNAESKKQEGITYRFTTGIPGKKNILLDKLRKLNVQGKGARRKEIPNIYLGASSNQRLKILRGLMDSDGWFSGHSTGFCSTSEKLVDGVIQLVQSLGGVSRKSYKKSVDAWTLSINIPINPFKLTRKASLWKPFTKYPPTRLFKKIEKIGKEPVRCISVSSPDRLYITDDYIVTHNTAQALGYITHSGYKRNLIVCPASVKFSWESEIKKWTNLKSFVVGSQTDLKDIPADINCIIVNFDILKKFFNEFMKYDFDCLVGDEIHMIKSSTAIRTKVFKGLSKNIPNVIMLTGTPVLSRPIEIFNVLNIIDPKVWNNYYGFATKYCDGKQGYWGYEAKGASNLEELKEKIDKYFLRRTKEEVLKELPPKNRIEIPIDLPKEERKQYELVESNLVEYLRNYKDKKDKEIVKSLQGEKLVKLNLLREINTMGKIPTVKELISNIIETGEKVLIFSSFNAPLKELYEEYEDEAVIILGETPVDERGEIVKRFQEKPEIKIFFGGTRSAGVGITLTAASNVIFLDLPWNPADIEQSENRAHRPGAVYESLNIYQIISRDSIDGFMVKLLKRKQEIIDTLIGGKVPEKENKIIDDYIKTLQDKYKNK